MCTCLASNLSYTKFVQLYYQINLLSTELLNVMHESTSVGDPEWEHLQVAMVTMGHLMQRVDHTLHQLNSLFLIVQVIGISGVCVCVCVCVRVCTGVCVWVCVCVAGVSKKLMDNHLRHIKIMWAGRQGIWLVSFLGPMSVTRLDTTWLRSCWRHSNIPTHGASARLSREIFDREGRVLRGVEPRWGDGLSRRCGERGVSGKGCFLWALIGAGVNTLAAASRIAWGR